MQTAEASFSEKGTARNEPPISNSVFGVIAFILTEAMFFVALISAYTISVSGAEEWPPAGQPRLPITATAFNSLMLLASAVTIFIGFKHFAKEGHSRKSKRWLLITIGLGAFFVLFQGFEWVNLLREGLTLRSSNYGAFFYLIIGTHAVHAVGALIALVGVYLKLRRGSLMTQSYQGAQVFWFFVVGVWPVLYVLVYLN